MFILSEVADKGIVFLLIPILTRILSPESLSKISTYTIIISLFTVFIWIGAHASINVKFFKLKKQELARYMCSLYYSFFDSLLLMIITFVFSPIISEVFSIESKWLYFSILIPFLQFFTIVNLSLWVNEKNPINFGVYQLLQTFLISTLSIFLIYSLKMEWEGRLYGILFGNIIFALISLIFIYKRGFLDFQFKKSYFKDILKFGIPLIPHSLSSHIRAAADRFIIVITLGFTLNGIFTIAFEFAYIIVIITHAIQKVWAPYLYSKLSSPDFLISEKKQLVTYIYIYFILFLLFCFVFSQIAIKILPYFVGENYVIAKTYIPYLCIGFGFHGLYNILSNFLFYHNKTEFLSIVTISCAIVHGFVLYFFTSSYGLIGVAQTSIISYFIMFVFVFLLVNKTTNLPWKLWKRHD